MNLRRLVLLAIVVIAVALPACRPRLDVSLATASEALPSPSFAVVEKKHPDAPRFHTIELFNEAEELVWHARAEPFGLPVVREPIRYGHAPEGFIDVDAPEPLETGKSYTLVVSGRGLGAMVFSVGADGSVSPARRR